MQTRSVAAAALPAGDAAAIADVTASANAVIVATRRGPFMSRRPRPEPETDHAEPSQCSTSARVSPMNGRVRSPTAKQLVVLVHDTAFSSAPAEVRFGDAAIDQAVPSQPSMNGVDRPPDASLEVPTAKQVVALGHDVPPKPTSAAAGPGAVTSAQVCPFQLSINGEKFATGALSVPAAKHITADTHETLPSEKLSSGSWPVLGVATGDQLLPFQRSEPTPPTAKQLAALEHETALNATAFGVFTSAQFLPFHRSIAEPTAKQLIALVQVTLSATLCVGSGAATIVHVLPFHCSISARYPALESEVDDDPTARQLVVLVHHTPVSMLIAWPPGFGVGTFAHVLPFQRSDSARIVLVLAGTLSPTAMHIAVFTHETALSRSCCGLETAAPLGAATRDRRAGDERERERHRPNASSPRVAAAPVSVPGAISAQRPPVPRPNGIGGA